MTTTTSDLLAATSESSLRATALKAEQEAAEAAVALAVARAADALEASEGLVLRRTRSVAAAAHAAAAAAAMPEDWCAAAGQFDRLEAAKGTSGGGGAGGGCRDIQALLAALITRLPPEPVFAPVDDDSTLPAEASRVDLAKHTAIGSVSSSARSLPSDVDSAASLSLSSSSAPPKPLPPPPTLWIVLAHAERLTDRDVAGAADWLLPQLACLSHALATAQRADRTAARKRTRAAAAHFARASSAGRLDNATVKVKVISLSFSLFSFFFEGCIFF